MASTSGIGHGQSERRFSYLEHVTDAPIREGTLTESELLSFDFDKCGKCLVVFLPRITELLENPSFLKKLAKKFAIDDFYLTKTAYDSNGFFRASPSEESVASRFLVKELTQIPHASQLHRIRQKMYSLYPKSAKQKNSLCSMGSEIVSIPEQSNQELVNSFVRKLPQWKLRDAVFARIVQEQSYQKVLEPFRNYKTPPPTQNFEFITDEERGAQDLARSFATSQGLSETQKSIDSVRAIVGFASDYSTNFLALLKNLAECHGPNQSCQHLELWMTKDEARAVLGAAYDVFGGEKANILHLLEEMLLRTFHEADCILEDKGNAVVQDKGRLPPPAANQEALPETGLTEMKQIYHWFFFFFWIKPLHQITGSNLSGKVLLCFDDADSPKVKGIIRSVLSKELASWDSPAKLLAAITEQVMHIYDTALWGFRVPVRDIEKSRLKFIEATDSQNFDVNNRSKVYVGMHELLRHLIHSQETLAAAETVLKATLALQAGEDTSVMQFCLTFARNMSLRAGAFVQRLNNEISLAFHIDNARQLERVDGLLYQVNRGGDVAKFVGYASILFLPGTFISGFFSMTFFGFDPQGSHWSHSDKWWIWFAITIPATAFGFMFLALLRSNKTMGDFLAALFGIVRSHILPSP